MASARFLVVLVAVRSAPSLDTADRAALETVVTIDRLTAGFMDSQDQPAPPRAGQR